MHVTLFVSCLVFEADSLCGKVREWFAEVQRRLDLGLDPFLEASAGGPDGDKAVLEDEAEMPGERSVNAEDQADPGAGDEEDDEDEEEDDGDETDDSEVWEPSRSVKKSLSLSED